MMHTESRSAVAHRRLGEILEAGARNAQQVIESIQRDVPQDSVVPSGAVRFAAAQDGSRVEMYLPDGPTMSLHSHALSQAGERVSLPSSYRDHLLASGGWGAELLAKNLTEGWAHREGKALIRQVGGQVRGILSDRFRRLDSRPIVEALASAAQHHGLVPLDEYALDVRNALKLASPRLQYITPEEPVLVGLSWSNSDYGAGTHSLSLFIMRLVCANGMVRDNLLREVHLGRQLTDATFTARTYELDTATSVSAVQDLVAGYLSPAKVEETVFALRKANETPVTPQGVAATLKAQGLTKSDAAKVTEAFTSADIEMMPAGATVYRLSNAISWVANAQEDRAKKLDLMRVAGAVLDHAA